MFTFCVHGEKPTEAVLFVTSKLSMASDQGQLCHRVRPRPKFLQNDEKRLHATCHVHKFQKYLYLFVDLSGHTCNP